MTGENCGQFGLLTWNSFICPMGEIVILAHCVFYLIREHGNLVQDPSNNATTPSYIVASLQK